MIIEKKCKHFVYQNDQNGELAISYCNRMTDIEKDHEGNDACYSCPLGFSEKQCFNIVSMGELH